MNLRPSPLLTRILDGILHGAVVGMAAGALDQLLRMNDSQMAWSPSAWGAVAALYGLLFAVVGGLIAPVFRRIVLVLAPLALLVVLAGWFNITLLPSLVAPRSLLFDAFAAAIAIASIFAGHRWIPRTTAPRARVLSAVLLTVAIALGVMVPHSSRSDADHRSIADATATAPDLLVVLLDALRADHCSSYGYPRETTPNLDQIAAGGVRFERVYSPSSWTKPVVASLFTGLHPASHHNHRISSGLPDGVDTIPQLLHEAGYETAVFAENNFVSRLFGFDRGVDHFAGLDPDVPAQTVVGHILQQLAVRTPIFAPLLRLARGVNVLDPGQAARAGAGLDIPSAFTDWTHDLPEERPVFAYVHLMKPHAPYVAPEPYDGFFGEPRSDDSPVNPPHVEGLAPFAHADTVSKEWVRRLMANYDERLRYGDALLGQVVDAFRAANRRRDLVVVVLADHGEEFGENGLFDHGHSLQEDVVRVPLVMQGPGFEAGRVVEQPVRLMDLPPTLLHLGGARVPETVQGRDLLTLLDGGDDTPRPVVAEVEHGPGYASRSLVSDELKLVVTEQNGQHAQQVFDLEQDPGETTSIARPGQDPLVWLLGDLESFLEFARSRQVGENKRQLDPAAEERLRGLGYIK